MTREFTRLTQRFGGVLAVAAIVAFVGGTTASIAAVENGKDAKKEDKRKDDEYRERLKKKVWRKFWMCHVEKDGKSKLMEISEEAVAAHRGHGDGEPGERVARHKHYRWARDCRETPEPTPPPPPPPPPPPASDATLSCPCWNGMKQSALAAILAPDSVPATPQCLNDSSTVSLSPDGGVNMVYATVFGQCIQRVGGTDVGQNFVLTGEEAALCVSEGASIVPRIKWCN
jgi:hypothetical protein